MTRTVSNITQELEGRLYMPDGALYYDTETGSVRVSIDTIGTTPKVEFYARNFRQGETLVTNNLADALSFIGVPDTRERKLYKNGVVYMVTRNDHPAVCRVQYRIHASDRMIFEMTTAEWDALPELK